MSEPSENDGSFCASLDRGSEETFEYFCQPCNFDGYHRKAHGYCLNCQDYLCEQCFSVHCKPMPLRHHVLQNESHMPRNTPPARSKDTCSEKCAKHEGEIIKLFCKSHQELGCGTCMGLDHRKCEDVDYIPELAKGIENSEEYNALKEKFDDLETQLKANEIHAKANVANIQINYSNAITGIRQFRKDITTFLDKLQNKIELQAKLYKVEDTTKIISISKACKVLSTDINTMVSEINAFKESKQNCQMFIAIKKAIYKMESLDEHLRQMKNENKVRHYKFNHVVSLDIIKNTRVLGVLDTNALRDNIATHYKDIRVKSTTIDDCDMNGMETLSGDMLIVADKANQTVKLLNLPLSKVVSELKCSSPPWDVTAISATCIGVTLPDEQKIQFVSLSNGMVLDSCIKVEGQCRGLGHSRKRLIVSYDNPGKLEMLDMTGAVLWVIQNDTNGKELFQQPWHIAVSADNDIIYVSDHGNHTITGHAMDGGILAKYKDGSLSCPRGLTVDKYGSVYVSVVISNNVHQLSKFFLEKRVLLSVKDGVRVPKALAYFGKSDRLCIGMNINNFIKVFQLQ